MTVFKGYLLILKNKLPGVLFFFGRFLIVTIINSSSRDVVVSKPTEANPSVRISIYNESDSQLASGFEGFLHEKYEIVELENDERIIREALYYRSIDAVITIPEDFEMLYLEENNCIDYIAVPGSVAMQFLKSDITTYLNQLRIYLELDYSEDKAISLSQEALLVESEVTVLESDNGLGMDKGFWWFMRIIPYFFLTSICYSVSSLLLTFRKKEVKRRISCSSYSSSKINFYSYLTVLLIGVIHFGTCIILPIILYGKEYLNASYLIYYILNVFAFTLVATSIGYIVGVVAKNSVVINAVINIVSLTGSFLGGVFVPLFLMGKEIVAIGKLLPTYWYTNTNDILGSTLTMTSEHFKARYIGYGIQLLFALAVFLVALVISKLKEAD